MQGRRLIEGDHPERLPTPRPFHRLHDDARALAGGLEAVAPQAGDVQQDVRRAIVGHDEAETLGDVEPLDAAGHFDEVESFILVLVRLAGSGDHAIRSGFSASDPRSSDMAEQPTPNHAARSRGQD